MILGQVRKKTSRLALMLFVLMGGYPAVSLANTSPSFFVGMPNVRGVFDRVAALKARCQHWQARRAWAAHVRTWRGALEKYLAHAPVTRRFSLAEHTSVWSIPLCRAPSSDTTHTTRPHDVRWMTLHPHAFSHSVMRRTTPGSSRVSPTSFPHQIGLSQEQSAHKFCHRAVAIKRACEHLNLVWRRDVLLLDGDDPRQVAWARCQDHWARVKHQAPPLWILINGSVKAVSKHCGHRVYLDQGEFLSHRLRITVVPAHVKKIGARLQITVPGNQQLKKWERAEGVKPTLFCDIKSKGKNDEKK